MTSTKSQNSAEKATPGSPEEKPKDNVATTPKEEAVKTDPKNYDAQVQRTKEALNKEPKVNFLINLSPGEKEGTDEIVIVNGYSYRIKKGCMVTIPESVAALLSNKYKVEMEAGKQHLLDNSEDRRQALQ